ncbi:hypothetical protein COBT_001789 [Conglomerata obtusa]
MSHDLEYKIKELVNLPPYALEKEIKSHLNKAYTLIHNYELELYEKEMYTDNEIQKIKQWRSTLIKNANRLKTQIYNSKTTNDEVIPKRDDLNDLEETVRLVSREICKTDKNISLLERSTLKLKGINYTSKDLEREISETRKMMLKEKLQEQKEVFLIKIAILIFMIVCLIIIFDIVKLQRFLL